LLALLGPSGSGKTTLLRLLAGLETPDAGVVRFDDEDAAQFTVQERRVGFVFQSYALFRHMTVFDNVAYGLVVRPRRLRPPRETIVQRVAELLEMMQLSGFERRYPAELSGGQRQRVAVARALAVDPELLIADEAVSALDVSVQAQLLSLFLDLRDELGVAILFVAHQLAVIAEVADRVAVMNEGRLVEIGDTATVFHAPQDEYTKALLAAHPHPDLEGHHAQQV
jgi:sulfate/thiosulfate transport system ATP-binding protein